jgi:activating signal cointegrator complex subunit 3
LFSTLTHFLTSTDLYSHYHEQVLFKKANHPEEINIDMYIPLFASSSQYLVRVVSDSWVGVELVYPVSLKETTLPVQTRPYTDLMDLTPLPTTVLQNDNYEKLFAKIETFNPVQTQLFHVLYHSNIPVLLGAPTGSGKTVVAELALLRMKRIYSDGICVYIAPMKSLARERLNEWRERFGGSALKWKVLELSGDTSHDRRALESADILVCTPEKWDLISRSWNGKSSGIPKDQIRKPSFVKRVRLLVIDEIHLLGEERGAVLEAIVSRMRFISRQIRQEGSAESSHVAAKNEELTEAVRIVGLSTAVENPLDLGSWIGIDVDGTSGFPNKGLYNFRPSIRPVETKIHIQGFPGKHYCPRYVKRPCSYGKLVSSSYCSFIFQYGYNEQTLLCSNQTTRPRSALVDFCGIAKTDTLDGIRYYQLCCAR